ncbi:MAG: hypothetical protein JXD21_03195, partial [Candidatus Omnitrophica bacterium]|nr:hypothetical protein [Candidatus Omnitrophota bacterium]
MLSTWRENILVKFLCIAIVAIFLSNEFTWVAKIDMLNYILPFYHSQANRIYFPNLEDQAKPSLFKKMIENVKDFFFPEVYAEEHRYDRPNTTMGAGWAYNQNDTVQKNYNHKANNDTVQNWIDYLSAHPEQLAHYLPFIVGWAKSRIQNHGAVPTYMLNWAAELINGLQENYQETHGGEQSEELASAAEHIENAQAAETRGQGIQQLKAAYQDILAFVNSEGILAVDTVVSPAWVDSSYQRATNADGSSAKAWVAYNTQTGTYTFGFNGNSYEAENIQSLINQLKEVLNPNKTAPPATVSLNCASYALSSLLNISPEEAAGLLAPYTKGGLTSLYGLQLIAQEKGLDLDAMAGATLNELIASGSNGIIHITDNHYISYVDGKFYDNDEEITLDDIADRYGVTGDTVLDAVLVDASYIGKATLIADDKDKKAITGAMSWDDCDQATKDMFSGTMGSEEAGKAQWEKERGHYESTGEVWTWEKNGGGGGSGGGSGGGNGGNSGGDAPARAYADAQVAAMAQPNWSGQDWTNNWINAYTNFMNGNVDATTQEAYMVYAGSGAPQQQQPMPMQPQQGAPLDDATARAAAEANVFAMADAYFAEHGTPMPEQMWIDCWNDTYWDLTLGNYTTNGDQNAAIATHSAEVIAEHLPNATYEQLNTAFGEVYEGVSGQELPDGAALMPFQFNYEVGDVIPAGEAVPVGNGTWVVTDQPIVYQPGTQVTFGGEANVVTEFYGFGWEGNLQTGATMTISNDGVEFYGIVESGYVAAQVAGGSGEGESPTGDPNFVPSGEIVASINEGANVLFHFDPAMGHNGVEIQNGSVLWRKPGASYTSDGVQKEGLGLKGPIQFKEDLADGSSYIVHEFREGGGTTLTINENKGLEFHNNAAYLMMDGVRYNYTGDLSDLLAQEADPFRIAEAFGYQVNEDRTGFYKMITNPETGNTFRFEWDLGFNLLTDRSALADQPGATDADVNYFFPQRTVSSTQSQYSSDIFPILAEGIPGWNDMSPDEQRETLALFVSGALEGTLIGGILEFFLGENYASTVVSAVETVVTVADTVLENLFGIDIGEPRDIMYDVGHDFVFGYQTTGYDEIEIDGTAAFTRNTNFTLDFYLYVSPEDFEQTYNVIGDYRIVELPEAYLGIYADTQQGIIYVTTDFAMDASVSWYASELAFEAQFVDTITTNPNDRTGAVQAGMQMQTQVLNNFSVSPQGQAIGEIFYGIDNGSQAYDLQIVEANYWTNIASQGQNGPTTLYTIGDVVPANTPFPIYYDQTTGDIVFISFDDPVTLTPGLSLQGGTLWSFTGNGILLPSFLSEDSVLYIENDYYSLWGEIVPGRDGAISYPSVALLSTITGDTQVAPNLPSGASQADIIAYFGSSDPMIPVRVLFAVGAGQSIAVVDCVLQPFMPGSTFDIRAGVYMTQGDYTYVAQPGASLTINGSGAFMFNNTQVYQGTTYVGRYYDYTVEENVDVNYELIALAMERGILVDTDSATPLTAGTSYRVFEGIDGSILFFDDMNRTIAQGRDGQIGLIMPVIIVSGMQNGVLSYIDFVNQELAATGFGVDLSRMEATEDGDYVGLGIFSGNQFLFYQDYSQPVMGFTMTEERALTVEFMAVTFTVTGDAAVTIEDQVETELAALYDGEDILSANDAFGLDGETSCPGSIIIVDGDLTRDDDEINVYTVFYTDNATLDLPGHTIAFEINNENRDEQYLNTNFIVIRTDGPPESGFDSNTFGTYALGAYSPLDPTQTYQVTIDTLSTVTITDSAINLPVASLSVNLPALSSHPQADWSLYQVRTVVTPIGYEMLMISQTYDMFGPMVYTAEDGTEYNIGEYFVDLIHDGMSWEEALYQIKADAHDNFYFGDYYLPPEFLEVEGDSYEVIDQNFAIDSYIARSFYMSDVYNRSPEGLIALYTTVYGPEAQVSIPGVGEVALSDVAENYEEYVLSMENPLEVIQGWAVPLHEIYGGDHLYNRPVINLSLDLYLTGDPDLYGYLTERYDTQAEYQVGFEAPHAPAPYSLSPITSQQRMEELNTVYPDATIDGMTVTEYYVNEDDDVNAIAMILHDEYGRDHGDLESADPWVNVSLDHFAHTTPSLYADFTGLVSVIDITAGNEVSVMPDMSVPADLATGTISIGTEYINASSVAWLASVWAHEASHVDLYRQGLPWDNAQGELYATWHQLNALTSLGGTGEDIAYLESILYSRESIIAGGVPEGMLIAGEITDLNTPFFDDGTGDIVQGETRRSIVSSLDDTLSVQIVGVVGGTGFIAIQTPTGIEFHYASRFILPDGMELEDLPVISGYTQVADPVSSTFMSDTEIPAFRMLSFGNQGYLPDTDPVPAGAAVEVLSSNGHWALVQYGEEGEEIQVVIDIDHVFNYLDESDLPNDDFAPLQGEVVSPNQNVPVDHHQIFLIADVGGDQPSFEPTGVYVPSYSIVGVWGEAGDYVVTSPHLQFISNEAVTVLSYEDSYAAVEFYYNMNSATIDHLMDEFDVGDDGWDDGWMLTGLAAVVEGLPEGSRERYATMQVYNMEFAPIVSDDYHDFIATTEAREFQRDYAFRIITDAREFVSDMDEPIVSIIRSNLRVNEATARDIYNTTWGGNNLEQQVNGAYDDREEMVGIELFEAVRRIDVSLNYVNEVGTDPVYNLMAETAVANYLVEIQLTFPWINFTDIINNDESGYDVYDVYYNMQARIYQEMEVLAAQGVVSRHGSGDLPLDASGFVEGVPTPVSEYLQDAGSISVAGQGTVQTAPNGAPVYTSPSPTGQANVHAALNMTIIPVGGFYYVIEDVTAWNAYMSTQSPTHLTLGSLLSGRPADDPLVNAWNQVYFDFEIELPQILSDIGLGDFSLRESQPDPLSGDRLVNSGADASTITVTTTDRTNPLLNLSFSDETSATNYLVNLHTDYVTWRDANVVRDADTGMWEILPIDLTDIVESYGNARLTRAYTTYRDDQAEFDAILEAIGFEGGYAVPDEVRNDEVLVFHDANEASGYLEVLHTDYETWRTTYIEGDGSEDSPWTRKAVD